MVYTSVAVYNIGDFAAVAVAARWLCASRDFDERADACRVYIFLGFELCELSQAWQVVEVEVLPSDGHMAALLYLGCSSTWWAVYVFHDGIPEAGICCWYVRMRAVSYLPFIPGFEL